MRRVQVVPASVGRCLRGPSVHSGGGLCLLPRRQLAVFEERGGSLRELGGGVLTQQRRFSATEGAALRAGTSGSTQSSSSFSESASEEAVVSVTRSFRQRAAAFLREGQLTSRLQALPHVSWRSLLRVVELVLAKPEALRASDLEALPALCRRLSVGSCQIVDAVVAAAALSPSRVFAPLAEQQMRRVAPSPQKAAEVESSGSPCLANFVAALADWRVSDHSAHRLALQRFFLASAIASAESEAADLLVTLDALADLRARHGKVPVECHEELALLSELLVGRLEERLAREPLDAPSAALEAFVCLARIPQGGTAAADFELEALGGEEQLRPLASLLAQTRGSLVKGQNGLFRLQKKLAAQLQNEAPRLVEDARKTAALLQAASALLNCPRRHADSGGSCAEETEAVEGCRALLAKIREALTTREASWSARDSAVLWRAALVLPERETPAFADALFRLDDKTAPASADAEWLSPSLLRNKVKVLAKSAGCCALQDAREARRWGSRSSLSAKKLLLPPEAFTLKDAQPEAALELLQSSADAFASLLSLQKALDVAERLRARGRRRVYRRRGLSWPSPRRRLRLLLRLAVVSLQRQGRRLGECPSVEAFEGEGPGGWLGLLRSAVATGSQEAFLRGLCATETFASQGSLRELAVAVRLCAVATAERLFVEASLDGGRRETPWFSKRRPRAQFSRRAPLTPEALQRLSICLRERLRKTRRWFEAACAPPASAVSENLISLQRFLDNRRDFILREADFANQAESLSRLLGGPPRVAGDFKTRPSRRARQEVAAVSAQLGKAFAETAEVQLRLLQEREASSSLGSENLASFTRRAVKRRTQRAEEALKALKQTLVALGEESRRCLYTAVVQQPVQRKQDIAPCAGEARWIEGEARRLRSLAETLASSRESPVLSGREGGASATDSDASWQRRREALMQEILREMQKARDAGEVRWGEAPKAPRRLCV